jgi:2-polyprenyl-3-methyl-5-hydroxy-6-metoxy-1,4-benzoquinol methylase
MKLPKEDRLKNEDHRRLYNFDRLEYHNPNKHSFVRIHYLNHVNRIINSVLKYGTECRILDVGSAQANISTILSEKGHHTIALDLRHNYLTYARMKYEYGKINYVRGSADKLPVKKGIFDIILLCELLEHVAYPEEIIEEAKRCLKDYGLIIITTPNGSSIYQDKKTFAEIKGDRAELVKNQFGPGEEEHLFLFKPTELKKLVEKADMRVIDFGYINLFHYSRFIATVYNLTPLILTQLIEKIILKIPLINERLAEELFFVCRKEGYDGNAK